MARTAGARAERLEADAERWARVQEIRIHTGTEHRVFYIVKFAEAVYVLHAFEKRARRTPQAELDLGRQRLRYLKVRSELMVNLQKVIAARRLKQAEAAKLLGVTQPRVSDLMRSRIDLFSIDTLIDMLARRGVRTKLVLQSGRRRIGVA